MLALLLGTHFFYPDHAPLARNDFLTIMAVLIQAGMLAFRLENWEEAKVILAFHVTGTIMEQFKTQAGSWNYADGGVLHIGMVPLYSGFMYAAVGSYIARIWRIFGFRFEPYPPRWTTVALAVAIYVNFFAHHWLPDIRLGLFAATALLFWRTRVYFTPFRTERWMPLLLGWFLVAAFIWFAENIGTFAHAWSYPESAPRLGTGQPDQARRVVSADDHFVRDGVADPRHRRREKRGYRALTIFANHSVNHAALSPSSACGAGKSFAAAIAAVLVGLAALPAQAASLLDYVGQCVPFARAASGIQIYGDAWTWWDQAEGRYQRGETPRVGAVVALRQDRALAARPCRGGQPRGRQPRADGDPRQLVAPERRARSCRAGRDADRRQPRQRLERGPRLVSRH